MTLTLRDYQQQTVDAVWTWVRMRDDHPVAVLPTGAGKTPVIAQLVRDIRGWGGRVLVLAHVKELLAQAHETLHRLMPERMFEIGLYSAGLRRRDTDHDVLIAGVQSVHNKAEKLGRRDVVIVDEAHLIPHEGDGMYQRLLRDLRVMTPHCRLVGLTATPYRLDSGLIYGHDELFAGCCYEAQVRTLIDQGYLCRLVGKQGTEADVSGVKVRGGEFVQADLDAHLSVDAIVEAAVEEVVTHCRDRKAWLVFCSGVRHADRVTHALVALGVQAELLTGETPGAERDRLVADFKAGRIRALVNVNVASIGFDAPHVDAVVMLRPTQSPGLYYQQIGRGFRIHDAKQDCLVLDLAGNIRRHGPVDQISVPKGRRKGAAAEASTEAQGKTCPECGEIVGAGTMICPECAYEWPPKHATKAEQVSPLTEYTEEVWEVERVDYQVWVKRGTEFDLSVPRTVCATYACGMQQIREWICPEHQGFARQKSERWWAQHCVRTQLAMPAKAVETLDAIDVLEAAGEWNRPTHIRIRLGGKFPEILGHEWRDARTYAEVVADRGDEVPF